MKDFTNRSMLAAVVLVLCLGMYVEACVPFTSKVAKELCGPFGYNMTSLDYRTQDEAAVRILEFKPLIKVQCSRNARIFFCSFFFPMCYSMANKGIPPCRSLCLDVKSGCEPLMIKFGFNWPEHLMNCSLFPQFGSGELCVFQNTSSSDGYSTTAVTQLTQTTSTQTTSTQTTSTQTTVKPTSKEPTKVVTRRISLKKRQKACSKSDDRAVKKCCRYGRKIIKLDAKNTCSLHDNVSKKRRLARSCGKKDVYKECYRSCCLYNKRKMQEKKKRNKKKNKKGKEKTKKNRKGKNKRRTR